MTVDAKMLARVAVGQVCQQLTQSGSPEPADVHVLKLRAAQRLQEMYGDELAKLNDRFNGAFKEAAHVASSVVVTAHVTFEYTLE